MFFFDFGSFVPFASCSHLVYLCHLRAVLTSKVEVSSKEGKIPLSCSELFLTTKGLFVFTINKGTTNKMIIYLQRIRVD